MADFCSVDTKITFEPGQEGDPICVDIDINNDMVCEGDESFEFILTPCPEGGVDIVNSPGTITIIDDDGNKLAFSCLCALMQADSSS
jgi:hypothetical protein